MEDKNALVNGFRGKRILVIGDLMLDTYLKGEVTRISAEAPVPVVKVENEFHFLGGAGNVAANVSSMGGKVTLFSFVGDDYQSEIVHSLLREKQIESFLDEDERTIHKLRIVGNNQQLSRADFEIVKDKKFSDKTKAHLKHRAQEADIIVISDYAKGAITEDLINTLAEFKRKIIADPKPKNKNLYKGILLVKANEKELFEMTQISNVETSGKKLREELQTDVIITRGRNGMTIFSDSVINIPTYAKEVFDVTGAGDTALAALALSIASNVSLNEAAIVANYAAGIKVEKAGTYAVSDSELLSKMNEEESKIVKLDDLQRIVSDLKKKGLKIVWTNGCFDLLHIGHITYLKESKKLGDILVVGINSDESVRKLKGPTRPIQTENERAEILASLEFVDYVIVFSEETCERYLRELKPDVFVKGGDRSWDRLSSHPEGLVVNSYGGEIKIIPMVEGKSTTKIIEKANLKPIT